MIALEAERVEKDKENRSDVKRNQEEREREKEG